MERPKLLIDTEFQKDFKAYSKVSDIFDIGAGAFGIVSLVTLKNRKQYAVKYSKKKRDIKNETNMLKYVWNNLSNYNKRFIIKPFNHEKYFQQNADKYLWQEYIHGFTLKSFLLKLRDFRSKIIKQSYYKTIINQLRKALIALWNIGVIHMDLHLNNILVKISKSNTPQRRISHIQLKLIDFGKSKKLHSKPGFHRPSNLSVKKWFKSTYLKLIKGNQYNSSGRPKGNPNLYLYGIDTFNLYAHEHMGLIDELYKFQMT